MTVKGDVLLLQLCRLFKCFCVVGGGVFTFKVFDFFFVLVSGNQLDLIETKTKLPQTFIEEFHKVTAMY